jgi:hypothetical protein
MFEFKWHVPGPTPSEVSLRIHSRSGWLARKVLTCDGQTVFRRDWLAGVETRFTPPGGAGRLLHLRTLQVPNSNDWRPALFADGVELPETTGTAPPRIVPPPKSLALPVGLTYLMMAIVTAMLPQTSTILDAFYIRRDDRKAVLTVAAPQASAPALSVDTSPLVPAVAGRPYAATLKPVGGTAPYTWARVRDGWPRGWNLNAMTGEFSGKPGAAHDLIARVTLADAAGLKVECPIALVVRRTRPVGENWPVITTELLPPGVLDQPYEFEIGRTGGQPPLFWKVVGKRRLPEGLQLDSASGVIKGIPRQAGQFPVTIRVVDDEYASSRDIGRWIAPFVVTAICLLGFLSMRKWSVYLYAALIVLQVAGAFALSLPISHTALGLQAILCVVGATHLGKMR